MSTTKASYDTLLCLSDMRRAAAPTPYRKTLGSNRALSLPICFFVLSKKHAAAGRRSRTRGAGRETLPDHSAKGSMLGASSIQAIR